MKIALALLLVGSFLSSLSVAEPDHLRWGGDASGAVPYLILDAKNPTKMVGFELEIAEALAHELGMKAQFFQNQWDKLVPGLQRKNYDFIINGIEITEERKAEVDFSKPYFYSYEQITVRKDDNSIQGWEDLAGKRVGSLKGSLAERMLKDHPLGQVYISAYEDQNQAYTDLSLKRIDAVLLDMPIALYYGGMDPELKNLDAHVGQLRYGICVRKGERERLAQINDALDKIIENGKLRAIYERWGLWNEEMAERFHDLSPSESPALELEAYRATFQQSTDLKTRIERYKTYIPLLLEGAAFTLQISSVAMFFAILFGLFIALIRLYGPPWVRRLALFFVELVRGTPLLIQLFLIYYGLPNIGIKLDPFTAAIIGLALNYSAYESEVYRAGIRAIPHSQMETALALGFSRWQALFHIIAPQALRVVVPPMTNDFISLLKDSSLVSVITLVELTRIYGQLAASSYDYFGVGILTAILYFLMGLPFVRLSRWVEHKFSHTDEHSGAQKKLG